MISILFSTRVVLRFKIYFVHIYLELPGQVLIGKYHITTHSKQQFSHCQKNQILTWVKCGTSWQEFPFGCRMAADGRKNA